MEDVIKPTHIAQSDGKDALGPVYFSARNFVQKELESFESCEFDALVKEFSDKFYSTVQDKFENFIIADAESNVQSHIWRTVDQIVRGILSGERWILERYLLRERYDCEKARAAVARHVPKELQDARIADLEAQVSKLKEDLDWYRSRA